MNLLLQQSYVTGFERLAVCASLLDDINVFPITDGDTGRNLLITLSPLKQLDGNSEHIIQQIVSNAKGNSGNIAAQFFSSFLQASDIAALYPLAQIGCQRSYQAIHDPKPGTMLTLLSDWVEVIQFFDVTKPINHSLAPLIRSVKATPDQLPQLKAAGVVDAGALGLFVFFEGFLRTLTENTEPYISIIDEFQGLLSISPSYQEVNSGGYCVEAKLSNMNHERAVSSLSKLADVDSLVSSESDNGIKLHFHTRDPEQAKAVLKHSGSIISWTDEAITDQIESRSHTDQVIHLMTDAAGSVTSEDARQCGFTLLNSYLIIGDYSVPETCLAPDSLYQAMKANIKTTTSQASLFERQQHYQQALARYNNVLYLCVGSAFTGNYEVAMNWKTNHDHDNRFYVIDSGAASGRLGIAVLAVARKISAGLELEEILNFAQDAVQSSKELVFLDKLNYLAAGGRISKTSAFFGDMLHIKPIISPLPGGAEKVGTARNNNDQLSFLQKRLSSDLGADPYPMLMLEYSDNRSYVEQKVLPVLKQLYPQASVLLQPLSLTSGTHMGPGTWGIAWLPGRFF